MREGYISATLRRAIRREARERCEYCGAPEGCFLLPHEVDHVIALKHDGRTSRGNLALSCTRCNKRKGSDIASIDPETGELVWLFHPRRDRWGDHFRFEGPTIVPLTAIGRTTVFLLQLNLPERVEERELLMEAGVFAPPPEG